MKLRPGYHNPFATHANIRRISRLLSIAQVARPAATVNRRIRLWNNLEIRPTLFFPSSFCNVPVSLHRLKTRLSYSYEGKKQTIPPGTKLQTFKSARPTSSIYDGKELNQRATDVGHSKPDARRLFLAAFKSSQRFSLYIWKAEQDEHDKVLSSGFDLCAEFAFRASQDAEAAEKMRKQLVRHTRLYRGSRTTVCWRGEIRHDLRNATTTAFAIRTEQRTGRDKTKHCRCSLHRHID